MNLHRLLFFLLVLCGQLLLAQQPAPLLSGTVSDVTTGQPLAEVIVTSRPSNQTTRTDSTGHFTLTLQTGDTALVFVALNYVSQTVARPTNTAAALEIKLLARIRSLAEVQISATATVAYGSQRYWVQDYVFSGPYCLIWVYRNQPEQAELVVLDSLLQVIKTTPVPYPVIGLFRDAFGTAHLICKEQVLQTDVVTTTSGVSVLFQESTLEAFNTFLLPLVAQSSTHYYYETYNQSRLSVAYTSLRIANRQQQTLLLVTDSVRTTMHDDEPRRRKDMEEQMQNGMGSQAIAFLLKSDPFYTAAILYKNPVAATLQRIRDSIYIFNLCTGEVAVYSAQGEPSRKLTLQLRNEDRLPKRVVVDDFTQLAYLYYENDGHVSLRLIDLQDGKLGAKIAVDYPYVKNVNVHNGWVWFTYRPRETMQHVYLYRFRT